MLNSHTLYTVMQSSQTAYTIIYKTVILHTPLHKTVIMYPHYDLVKQHLYVIDTF
jgi:hypothetical protein